MTVCREHLVCLAETPAQRRELIEQMPAVWVGQRDHPPHLMQLVCGHMQRSILMPKRGRSEWCVTCGDFQVCLDGV